MNVNPIFKLFSLTGVGQTIIRRQLSMFVISVGVLLLAFVLAACGAAAPKAAPANTTVSSFPNGKFLLADNKDRALQFNQDGTFFALAGDTHLAEGTYSVKGDVYTEESNNQGCPVPMHYTYTFDGVKLKFQPVEDPAKDPCAGRKGDFNETVTWVLSQ